METLETNPIIFHFFAHAYWDVEITLHSDSREALVIKGDGVSRPIAQGGNFVSESQKMYGKEKYKNIQRRDVENIALKFWARRDNTMEKKSHYKSDVFNPTS